MRIRNKKRVVILRPALFSGPEGPQLKVSA
jgi:hypothetical protein